MDKLTTAGIAEQMIISAICILFVRMIGKIYNQVWRYGGIQCYMRLIFTDGIAFVLYLGLELILPVQKITFARMLSSGEPEPSWSINDSNDVSICI